LKDILNTILFILLLFSFGDGRIKFFQGSLDEAKITARNEKKLVLIFFLPEDNPNILQNLDTDPGFVSLSDSFINILISGNSREWNLLKKL